MRELNLAPTNTAPINTAPTNTAPTNTAPTNTASINTESISSAISAWHRATRDELLSAARDELSTSLNVDSDTDQGAALLDSVDVSVIDARLCRGAWLQVLSDRVGRLARGELPERPDPQFIEEVTPSRSRALEPLTTRLEARSGPLDIERAITRGLSEVGALGLLLLLGQRRTSASLSSALGFPPDHDTLYASFDRAHTPGKVISVGGRAFTKHAARSEDPWWGHPKGNDEAKNQHARRVLSQILENPTWWNTFYHYKQGVVFEAREPQGHGARWADQGRRFIGFLEPFDESRGGTTRRVTTEITER